MNTAQGASITRKGREVDPAQVIEQMSRGDLLPVNGGAWAPVYDDETGATCGVFLPQSKGRGVVVFLAPDDLYTVERVQGDNVLGRRVGLYSDEMSAAMFRAGMYASYPFGDDAAK